MAFVIVLDASVLIAYLDGEDKHHGRAEALLAREIDDDFAANSLTLAEVLVVPVRETDSTMYARHCRAWNYGSCPLQLTPQ